MGTKAVSMSAKLPEFLRKHLRHGEVTIEKEPSKLTGIRRVTCPQCNVSIVTTQDEYDAELPNAVAFIAENPEETPEETPVETTEEETTEEETTEEEAPKKRGRRRR